ncbi:MAG: plasmid mobilization protein [Bacteroidota bacterium]
MGRKRTHLKGARTRMVCIRLTDDDFAQRSAQARELGLTVSGLCERLVRDGRIVSGPRPAYTVMDPALFNELRRIGNNANQIAHALNSNLPADTRFAWKTAHDLISALLSEELAKQKTQALRTRTIANDSPPPQTRAEFQRSVRLYPARRRDDFP